jgi:hypothetical protein
VKTIDEIRADNAKKIINHNENGNITAFAKNIGTDPAYIYQCFSLVTKKNIGNELARRIEQVYEKPRGWMDNVINDDFGRGGAELDSEIMELAIAIRKLPRSKRSGIRALISPAPDEESSSA